MGSQVGHRASSGRPGPRKDIRDRCLNASRSGGGGEYPAGMAAQVLDGEVARHWFRLAADALALARSAIDGLNVFPVPDADTGTNLHRTMTCAADAVAGLPPRAAQAEIWRAAATAAMRGACGNSGIIVSELLRGLADVCGPASPCDGRVLARALGNAAALARAAVQRPAEGTVLTVADAAARAVSEPAGEAISLAEVTHLAAVAARLALAQTTGKLEMLAACGVVDAGAAGLCVLLDALCAAVGGTAPGGYAVPEPAGQRASGRDGPLSPAQAAAAALTAAALTAVGQPATGSYEVTFLLQAAVPQVRELRERLDRLGDCLVVSGGEPQWHVHVHVPDAGAVIEAGLLAGRPTRVTVTCLHGHRAQGPGQASAGRQPVTGHRVVTTAEGAGLIRLLREAGAVVLDGQEEAAADRAAAPAIRLTLGKPIGGAPQDQPVVQVGSPVQALAALAVHDPGRPMAQDAASMRRAAAGMRYASVTAGIAVVGAVGGDILARGTDQGAVALAVIERLLAPGAELVTLLSGAGADPGLADLAAARASQILPAAEITCYEGGMASAVLLMGAE